MKAFRKHPLYAKTLFGIGRSAAFAASLIAMAGSSAQAESPADTSQAVQPSAVPGHPEPQLEEVVVTGIRASLERAMDIKRDADFRSESRADTSQAVQPSAVPGHPEPQLEEVVVTGIRASLERAMDIKRDADVVVDSISAEDIGKFPDSNVADSLQRITGVAIDRNQVGEGQTVTIRGFGPAF